MDSDGSNKWLSIASNVAVFVGLVLVAYEINQTQRQMEISELADAADDFTQSMQTLSESDSLAELLYLAETDYDSLDDFQRWRLFKWLHGFMIMSEQDYFVLIQMGDLFEPFRHDWIEFMQLSMYRDFWARNRDSFTAEFQEFIEASMEGRQP
jgi:hypothetical protein